MTRLLALCALALSQATASAPAQAQAVPFRLAAEGCPMAHCDPRMSDLAGSVSPSVASLVAIDSAASGGKYGLGCSSNLQIVACMLGGNVPGSSNFVVYDADGRRLWDDGGLLGATAWMSAPIVGSDGSVIAADQKWILRVNALGNTVLWKSRKPDSGNPISPVLVGSDTSMVFLATNTSSAGGVAELSVWDAATGAPLAHQPLVDQATGKVYVTRNTPAVRGNRAYVLAEAEADESDGRLYAVDICDGLDCGGRGTILPRWHFDFKGPSGASPLLIDRRLYFDGRPTAQIGSFMAVADDGTAPSLVWRRQFAGHFRASAAQDPRGGLWVAQGDAVLRLNANTGATDQTVVVGTAAGLGAGYRPASIITVSRSATDAVLLTLGMVAPNQGNAPSYVAALDVSSTPAGAALWSFRVAPNATSNLAAGQFPIAVSTSGARRIVFQGSNASTFFVGEP